MSYFIQAKDYVVIVHAKFECMNMHAFFNNFFNI
jgi:hypothetical protein